MIVSAFFFLKVALAVQGLCGSVPILVFYSSSVKNVVGILIGIPLNLWIVLGKYGHFNSVLPFSGQVLNLLKTFIDSLHETALDFVTFNVLNVLT